MPAIGNRLTAQRCFVLGVFLATALAYLPVLHAGFVWDDYEYIVNNQTLRGLDGLRRIWLEPRANSQYYPLVYTTFWVEYQLWALRPVGYHAINVLLHAGNALLVFALLRRLSLPGARLAALLFALHPVHVESVAWITERKNVLSGFFYLAAALVALRSRGLAAAPRPGAWRDYALALLLFVCALLSKSVTASLPAAFLIVVYWKTGRVGVRDVLWVLPFLALGVAAGLHTAWLERVHVGAAGGDWAFTPLERWLIASRALCFYPAKLLWPASLTFSYPRWHIDPHQGWQYAFGAAVIACFALLWLARRRIGRGPLVAALFFAGTLLPALGFVDVYPMRFSFVADHFQYLASLGILVPLAAWAARALGATGRTGRGAGAWIGPAAVAAVLATLASLTFLQSRIYQNEEILWRDTLRENPDSWLAHNNLGRILGFRGEHALAMQHFRRVIELKPDYYVGETNLAEALIRLERYEEAIGHLRQALAVEPNHADAHYFLWVALGRRGEWDEAVVHLRRERALKPSFQGHLDAAQLLARAGRRRDALLELDDAEAIRPSSPEVATRRGDLYLVLGDLERAAAAYRAAVRRAPDAARAHARLGLALERLGDASGARQHYARALALEPGHAEARRGLARLRAPASGTDPAPLPQRSGPPPSPRTAVR